MGGDVSIVHEGYEYHRHGDCGIAYLRGIEMHDSAKYKVHRAEYAILDVLLYLGDADFLLNFAARFVDLQ